MNPPHAPRWMFVVLILAGIYNLSWGTFVVALPETSFRLGGLAHADRPLNYPEVWQCVGMVVGVYGVGYAIAAFDPLRHWPIVLVGLLGKVFGPIGVALAVARGDLSATALWTNLGNDFVWWIPFGVILWRAWRVSPRA